MSDDSSFWDPPRCCGFAIRVCMYITVMAYFLILAIVIALSPGVTIENSNLTVPMIVCPSLMLALCVVDTLLEVYRRSLEEEREDDDTISNCSSVSFARGDEEAT